MSQRDVEAVPQTAPATAPADPARLPVVPLLGRAGALARMGVDQRAGAVRALSAGAGNASVSRMLNRSILSDLKEFKHGIDIDLPTASTEEKLAEIQRLLGQPAGALAATVVWESMPDLLAVAKANAALFMTCAKRDPTLLENEAFDEVRRRSRPPWKAQVLGNLRSNRDYVSEQMQAVGVTAGTEAEAAETTAEQDHAVRKAQILAEQVALWQDGMAKAKLIKVGRNLKRRSGGYRRDFDTDGRGRRDVRPGRAAAHQGRAATAARPTSRATATSSSTTTRSTRRSRRCWPTRPPCSRSSRGGQADAAAGLRQAGHRAGARAARSGALTELGGKIDEAVAARRRRPRLPRFHPGPPSS